MNKIHILPEHVVNKISAGEVVERPSSILKELLENALDAKSTEITVSITGAGIESISVEDNGMGMSKDEAILALKRYSTSKIKDDNDLYSIATLGFRGEALPSIAAVSKVSIETKERNTLSGTRIECSAGEIISVSPAGCKDGTLIRVSNVFFNTPARKKFLKSDQTEIHDTIAKWNRIACGFPNVAFSLHTDSKKIHYPRQDLYKVRALRMLDMNEEDVIDVEYSGVDMELRGFISHPRVTKSNAQSMFTYVNNRSIVSSTLKAAISNAYQDLIPHGRYPIVMLSMNMPPHRVDVNVHPRKEEVKFANQNELYQLIYKVIKSALVNKNYYRKSVETSSSDIVIPSYYEGFKKKPLSDESSYQMNFIEPKEVSKKEHVESYQHNIFSDSTIIGQYQSTYIILEKNNELILLDQHAAAERITYEKLSRFEEKREEGAQGLLFPETIDIRDRNKTIVSYIVDELRALGFHVAIHNEAVVFSGVPNLFFEADLAKLFGDLYEEIEENDLTRTSENAKKAILKTLSCHHSLRAHKNLNKDQIRLLLTDLDRAKHNETCPHGRPIYIKYSLGEIERIFGRA